MWKIRLVCVLMLCLEQHMVESQFGFMNTLGPSIASSFGNFGGFGGFGNLGSTISNSIHQSLAPLANLGAEINQGVQSALAPVRALGIKQQMMQGVGGVTIARYEGFRPATFVIKNGRRSICRGVLNGPNCNGPLEPFIMQSREDYCFAPYFAVAGDNICLSPASMSVIAVNNNLNCKSNSGSTIFYTTQVEYQQMCGLSMPPHAHFTYYANPNDPQAVRIPSLNTFIQCEEDQPGVCTFDSEIPGGSGGNMVAQGGTSSFMFSG